MKKLAGVAYFWSDSFYSNTLNIRLILACFVAFSLLSLPLFAQKPLWYISEQTSLFVKSSFLPENPQDTVLFGEVLSQGVELRFRSYTFADTVVVYREAALKEFDKIPRNKDWYKVQGHLEHFEVSGRGQVSHLFVKESVVLRDILARVQKSARFCRNWLHLNLPRYDLNAFKTTRRYQDVIEPLTGNLNLNRQGFFQADDLVFIDLEQELLGFICGSVPVYKGPDAEYNLEFLVVCDLYKPEVRRVIVFNPALLPF